MNEAFMQNLMALAGGLIGGLIFGSMFRTNPKAKFQQKLVDKLREINNHPSSNDELKGAEMLAYIRSYFKLIE